jgi:hypothetical protein
MLAAGSSRARGESAHVFGIHFHGWGANADVMSHRTGWSLEYSDSDSGPNVAGRIQPLLAEGFTLIQRLDWNRLYNGSYRTVPIDPIGRLGFANECAGWALQIKDYCRHYVLGNEMELSGVPNANDYALAFQQARDAIRAVQPDARVIIGHFVNIGNLRSVVQTLGPDGYDGVSDHTGSSVPTARLDLLDEENARPEVGVYITEWGWLVGTNPNAGGVIRSFYEGIAASNASRARQVYAACWFVYQQGGGWNTFSLELAGYLGYAENPGFEAATALGTCLSSYADNPVIMTDLIADVPDAGTGITCTWNTDVPARTQLQWRELVEWPYYGSWTNLDPTLTTAHAQTVVGLSPQTGYELHPTSTADDHADAGGRRFKVKTGPWPTTAAQTGPGRVKISWQTDWPADSIVLYGPTDPPTQTLSSAGLVTDHQVQITGLCEPQTMYYRVLSGEANPDGNAPLRMRSPIRTFEVGLLYAGDEDGDTDIDQADFGRFQACLSGPGIAQPNPGCAFARLDPDGDVDLNDFSIFQTCMSGANIPGDPLCNCE